MAELVDIAEAVKTALAAGVAAEVNPFGLAFDPERVMHPHRDGEDCGPLRVDVIGRKERSARMTRGGNHLQEAYEIDVAVRQLLKSLTDKTQFDGLVGLVKSIKSYFFANPLTGRGERLLEAHTDATDPAEWWGASIPQNGLFFSVLTLVYTGVHKSD